MILGIICCVTGVIAFIHAFSMSPEYAPQQTIQYLAFVYSSIFEVGGMVMIVISRAAQNIIDSSISARTQGSTSDYVPHAPPPTPISGDTWVCKKCGESNLAAAGSCKGCGEYR